MQTKLLVAVGLLAAALAGAGLARGSTPGVEKRELGAALGKPDELVVYDSSHLLLLASFFEGPNAIMRVNADGSLDRSFGQGGRLEMPFSDVAVKPDGKILVASSGPSPADPTGSDGLVTQLLPNGSRDPSFGKDGVANVDLGGRYDGLGAVTLTPDGKIVLGGTKQTVEANRGGSDARPVVARLLSNGSVDQSFGRDGVRLLPGGSEGGVFDVVPAPHGGIVAEGEGYIGTKVWKLTASGALDRRFGKRGSVDLEGRGKREKYGLEETLETIPRIGVLANGEIMLAGTGSTYWNGGSRYRVLALRLRDDGSINRAYGRNGYAMAKFGGSTFAESAAFLPGGRLVVACSAQVPDGKESDVGAIAFGKNGRVDRRFGNHGKVKVNLRGWDFAADVVARGRRAVILGEAGKGKPRYWLIRVPLAGA